MDTISSSHTLHGNSKVKLNSTQCCRLTLGGFILHRFHAAVDGVSIIPGVTHSKFVHLSNAGTLDKSSTLMLWESAYIFGIGGSRNVFCFFLKKQKKHPLNSR